jgi:2'-5' RNA ligase
VRWSAPEAWHVTLRFLGDVADTDAVAAALAGRPLRRAEAVTAGGAVALNRSIVCVQVEGLDALAGDVETAVGRFAGAPRGPFRGHITLGRSRRLPAAEVARRVATDAPRWRWIVDEVALVASDLRPDGARYQTLATVSTVGTAGGGPPADAGA